MVLAVLAGLTGSVLADSRADARAGRVAAPIIDDEPWEPPEPPEPEDPLPPEPEPEPDPTEPQPPAPDPKCDDAGGFARPSGAVPPGYVYAPTEFHGPGAERQEDDTFVADAPGHASHVGALRTRVVGGQEQMLVCAHVGANQSSDLLTPFPKPAPGAHPATISPRVVLIDAVGGQTSFEFGAAGTDSTLSHYAGSTDVHEGYAQMWVPFNASLREPGFVVRVEIRGTPAILGGRSLVMGADEVYVHVGQAPQHRSSRVAQAVGLTVDDSAVAERPEEPGPDDLSALVAPEVEKAIKAKMATFSGDAIPPETNWSPDPVAFFTAREGVIQSIGIDVEDFALDIEAFNPVDGRGKVRVSGTAFPRFKIAPRSFGIGTITGGTCDVYATVKFDVSTSFVINLAADDTRLELDLASITANATVESVQTYGTIELWYVTDVSCSHIQDKVSGGVRDVLKEKLATLQHDDGVEKDVEAAISDALAPADLANGPLSKPTVELSNGVGFRLLSPRYVKTGLRSSLTGDVAMGPWGMRLGAGALVYDEGGSRFPYSYVPSSFGGPLGDNGSTYVQPDLAMVINGATVNQLGRAMTAGERRPITVDPGPVQGLVSPDQTTVEVGLLDLQPMVQGVKIGISPSVPPLYLPSPPPGWPVDGKVDLLVPSLRVRVPGIASVAVDVRVGANASIDGTNRLVPEIRTSQVKAAARFLQLEGTVARLDPALDTGGLLELVRSTVQQSVPDALGDMLRPVRLPDLAIADGPEVHLTNLTLSTVGGGHLGVYADVQPGPGPNPALLSATFTTGADGAPTHVNANVLTPLIPLPGDPAPVSVTWTFVNKRDGTVLHKSPAGGEPSLTKSIPTSGLNVLVNPCTGERTAVIGVSAVVSKDGVRKDATTEVRKEWQGPPPTSPPLYCDREPEEPEPEEPPIPPMCRVKPWLCEDL